MRLRSSCLTREKHLERNSDWDADSCSQKSFLSSYKPSSLPGSIKKEKLSSNDSCVSDFDTSSVALDDDSSSIASTYCDSVISFDARSIFSINSFHTAPSEFQYQSSISRPHKRVKSSYSDYDPVPSNGVVQTEIAKISSNSVSSRPRCFNVICVFLFFILILSVSSLFLLIILSLCESQNQTLISTESLNSNVSQCLIGHEHSIPLVVDGLDRFFKQETAEKIHIIRMIGPVGVGKSYAKELIKKFILPKVNVIDLSSSLLKKDGDSMENDIAYMIGGLDYCKPNVIFVDGIDNNVELVSKYLIKFSNLVKLDNLHFFKHIRRKIIFCVIGSHGSNVITTTFAEHLKKGNYRHDFDLNVLKNRLLPFNLRLNDLKDYSSITIPFLPLQIHHLSQCVIQHLNALAGVENICETKPSDKLYTFLKEKDLELQDVIDKTLRLSLNSQRLQEILPFGCKRVYHSVASIVFQMPGN